MIITIMAVGMFYLIIRLALAEVKRDHYYKVIDENKDKLDGGTIYEVEDMKRFLTFTKKPK